MFRPKSFLKSQGRGKAQGGRRREAEADGDIARYREIEAFSGQALPDEKVEDAFGIIRPPVFPFKFEIPDARPLALAEVGGEETERGIAAYRNGHLDLEGNRRREDQPVRGLGVLTEELYHTGRRRYYVRRDVVFSPVKRCDVLH